jgi:glycine/D-amino acid oxidase-like deaminating enzyme/nitrite reductase/ring-hydroxylating ferredoxin subunit
MTSLWLDRDFDRTTDPLPEDGSFQDVVVGAGLTGLTTALLLARAGRRVGVVEARHFGAVTTGRTTAKASLLQGSKLSGILKSHTKAAAAAYLEANREGQAWVKRFCEDHGVGIQTRDAIVYAAKPTELPSVRKEHKAAESLGLEVSWVDDLAVPFPNHGATVLGGQLQFDPMELLEALVAELRSHGGTLHEGHRVRSVSRTGRPELELADGRTLTADNVVLATGIPILDRAMTFAKVEPKRSYLIAYTGPQVPLGMYLSLGSSSRSLRDVPTDDGRSVFLVGGSGHTVGRTGSEELHLQELRDWTSENFPGAVETHAWSAQDYSPYDGLPMMGKLPLGLGRIYYGTGYDKWGMTNAVAASLTIATQILGGREPDWAKALDHRIPKPRAGLHVTDLNAKVGVRMATGHLRAAVGQAPDSVPEGEGAVGRDPVVPAATSTVDGRTCKVQAICTHLGGALKWNDAEKSWDCPLHGSRFAPDGEVLEGPATRPLAQR